MYILTWSLGWNVWQANSDKYYKLLSGEPSNHEKLSHRLARLRSIAEMKQNIKFQFFEFQHRIIYYFLFKGSFCSRLCRSLNPSIKLINFYPSCDATEISRRTVIIKNISGSFHFSASSLSLAKNGVIFSTIFFVHRSKLRPFFPIIKCRKWEKLSVSRIRRVCYYHRIPVKGPVIIENLKKTEQSKHKKNTKRIASFVDTKFNAPKVKQNKMRWWNNAQDLKKVRM